MKKFAKWLVMILVVSCICALTLFATGCGEKDKSVKSITVNDNGEIVAVYDDDTTATLGKVGLVKSAEMKDGKFVLTLSDGKTIECAVAATAKTVVSIKTVGNELEITYSTGDVEKISLGTSVTCEHKNATYVEQVAHKLSADGKEINGVYLELCPDCGYAYTFVGVRHDPVDTVIAPTCTEGGYTTEKCSVCGKESEKKDITKALGHNYVARPVLGASKAEAAKWCLEGGLSIQVCDRCKDIGDYVTIAKEDAYGHHSDAWTLKEAPKYDTNGTLSGTCNVCGNVVEVSIPACKDSKYTVSDVTPENVSCSTAKKGTFTIEVDGQKIVVKDVAIPGSLHTFKGVAFDDTKTVKFADDAAFAASGLKLMGNTNPLSCNMTSNAWFACDECGETISVVVKKAHVPVDASKVTTVTPATCEKAGVKQFECVNCKNKEAKEEIPAVGHDYKYEVNEVDGKYTIVGTCQNVANELVAAGDCEHATVTYTNLKSVDRKVTKEATCKEDGVEHFVIVDADNKTTEFDTVIKKLNHNLKKADGTTVRIDESKVYLMANYPDIKPFGNAVKSCKAPFGGSFVCEDCKEVISVTLKIDHKAPEGTVATKATCTTAGVRSYTCEVCETPVVDEVVEAKLGHKYEYTEPVKGEDGKYTITGTCVREVSEGRTCGDQKVYTFDSLENKVVVRKPTCQEKGLTQYFVTIDGVATTLSIETAEIPHVLNGKDVDLSKPLDLATKGVKLFGNTTTPACSNENGVGGYFVCETCNEVIAANVITAHTKPATIPEENITPATCANNGKIVYTCEVCKKPNCEEVIPATGHAFKTAVEHAYNSVTGVHTLTVKVTCTNKDCAYNEKEVVTTKDFSEEKYSFVKLVDQPATCANEGLTKYSFVVEHKATVASKENTYKLDCTVEFITDRLAHSFVKTAKLDDDGNEVLDDKGNVVLVDKIFEKEIVEGEGDDAKTYILKVKICKDCGKVILVEKVEKPADDTTSD